MNKKVNKNDGIKDSISKLFILRDSCTGTCITQKDAPNIIWFEGAAVLLQQGVDKLKSAQHKIDSGDEDVSKESYFNVKDTVTKLIVLKNSCRGVSLIEDSDENANWFEGAESIICEVIDQLQNALQKIESQTAISSAVDSSESKESAPSDTAAASEPKASESKESTPPDTVAASMPKAAKEESKGEVADEAEKKAAAG